MLKILTLILVTLPLAAQQLDIVEASYGAGSFQMNVAQKLQGLIQNNVLDVSVDPGILGGDPSPGNAKRLRVVYRYGGRQYEASAGDYERVRIPANGATTTTTATSAGGFSLGDLWGRTAAGSGSLRIVSARYGQGSRYNDVRDRLQNLVRNDALSVPVDNTNMGGDPAPANAKALEVTYEYRGASYQTSVKEGATLVLPASTTAPATTGTLRIATARYGDGTRFNDVRDRLQNLVSGNTLSIKADNSALGGDPAVGKDKVLEVTYEWNGAVYAASAKEGRSLTLPESGAQPISVIPSTPVVTQPSRGADTDASRSSGNRAYGPAVTASGGREVVPVGRPGGLRIFYARYGVPGNEIDVRERLRPLLQNDAVNTVVGAESMGADPAPNVVKTLTVIYEVRGRTFEKTASDGQPLVLP